jgi:4-alpha-glucanotransferase
MNKGQGFDRCAGILMPVSSLPSPYGIGTLGKAAYEFVDFVVEAGHHYWQVLPLGPTSYGDSPYQSFSAFAGNPYFIDLDMLVEDALLDEAYVNGFDWGGDGEDINYSYLFENRFVVLKKAYGNFLKTRGVKGFEAFKEEAGEWLDEYSSYMAIKAHFGYRSWCEWDDDIRFRKPAALEKYKKMLAQEMDFWAFCQYEFSIQWKKLKAYANGRGVEIIGDIPIYVALDSSDVWCHPDMFLLDKNLAPVKVAGVPPDAFTDLGQKWGNPLYDWDALEKDDFGWWRRRMSAQAGLYDVIRIDHFLGVIKYYTIPAHDPDAKNGEYKKGPGRLLTDAINQSIGDKRIIAEDLGVEMPEVEELLRSNGYPGMKVLEFAFDGNAANPHLPHNYTRDLVVYGGTHDNETLLGYYSARSGRELEYAIEYLNAASPRKMVEESFRVAYLSVAATVIFQMQDILCLGNEARINFPSTLGGNWQWRMKKGVLTHGLAEGLRKLARISGRIL